MTRTSENSVSNAVFGTGGAGSTYTRPTYNPELDKRYEVKPEEVVLETFGITDRNGKDIMSGWKITEGRKAGDHGYKGTIAELSPYGKALFDDMFAGWN